MFLYKNVSISSRARKPYIVCVILTLESVSWKQYMCVCSIVKLAWADQKLWPRQANAVCDLWPWTVTLILEWGWWKRNATLRLVMVHACMKYHQSILNGSKVMARTSKYCIWPLTVNSGLGVRVMKAVRDTPSSDGACVYEVSSKYLEWIKSYGPDKHKVTVFDLWPWTVTVTLEWGW
jgi:hypothetical protein